MIRSYTGLDIDGKRRGSAANLTTVLFLDKNLIVCWGLALIARPEEHTHEDPFWIFGLPTYSTYEVGNSTVPW